MISNIILHTYTKMFPRFPNMLEQRLRLNRNNINRYSRITPPMDFETYQSINTNPAHNTIREIIKCSVAENETVSVEIAIQQIQQDTRLVFTTLEIKLLIYEASKHRNHKIIQLLLNSKQIRVDFTPEFLSSILSSNCETPTFKIVKVILKSSCLNEHNVKLLPELRLHLAHNLLQKYVHTYSEHKQFEMAIIRAVRILASNGNSQQLEHIDQYTFRRYPINIVQIRTGSIVQLVMFILRDMHAYRRTTPMERFQINILQTLNAKTFPDKSLCIALCSHGTI
jgi:hypothetical protein